MVGRYIRLMILDLHDHTHHSLECLGLDTRMCPWLCTPTYGVFDQLFEKSPTSSDVVRGFVR